MDNLYDDITGVLDAHVMDELCKEEDRLRKEKHEKIRLLQESEGWLLVKEYFKNMKYDSIDKLKISRSMDDIIRLQERIKIIEDLFNFIHIDKYMNVSNDPT